VNLYLDRRCWSFLVVLLIFLPSWWSCANRMVTHRAPSPYEEGLKNFQKGELVAAIQEWERVERGHSRYKEARMMINVANNILVELVTLHLQRGADLEKDGRLSEALKEYQRAVRLDPRRTDAEENVHKVQEILTPMVRYHLNLAQELECSGEFRQALDELRLVAVFDPDDQEMRVRIIRLEERMESDTEGHYKAGLEYFQAEDYQSAEREMRAVLSLKLDHEGARGYLEEIERIRQELKKSETKADSPLHTQLRERQARLKELKAKEDWVQVRREAKSLLEIDPYDAETKDLLRFAEIRFRERVDFLFQEGIRHFQGEDLDLAISYWRQTLSLDSEHEKARDYMERANLMREKIRRIKGQKIEPTS
jgi:tetratricopeptide (TPR) repeat protein